MEKQGQDRKPEQPGTWRSRRDEQRLKRGREWVPGRLPAIAGIVGTLIGVAMVTWSMMHPGEGSERTPSYSKETTERSSLWHALWVIAGKMEKGRWEDSGIVEKRKRNWKLERYVEGQTIGFEGDAYSHIDKRREVRMRVVIGGDDRGTCRETHVQGR